MDINENTIREDYNETMDDVKGFFGANESADGNRDDDWSMNDSSTGQSDMDKNMPEYGSEEYPEE